MVNPPAVRIETERAKARGLKGVLGSQIPDVTRLRIWFSDRAPTSEIVAELIGVLAQSGTVSIEFLENGPAVREVSKALGISLEVDPELRSPVSFDALVSTARVVIDRLGSYPLAVWIGVDRQALLSALREQDDSRRAERLPHESIYLILSLYDDNVAVIAKGISADHLGKQVRHAAQRAGIQLPV